MHVGFGSLNTFSGSYRSTAALADMLPQRRPSEQSPAAAPLAANKVKAAAASTSAAAPVDVSSASLEADTAAFATAAGKMLQAAGRSLPPEVMLSLGSDGQVAVINSRPDAVQIELQFANNPALTTSFSQLAAKAAMVRAAGSGTAGQMALPDAGVASIGGVRFHLVLTPQGPEVFFAGAAIGKA
jgi:hypothetical protein